MNLSSSLETHVERVLLVSDGPARYSGVLLLKELFSVPGFLANLVPTQNYRLGGVLLSAFNYEINGSGSKPTPEAFYPALSALWKTWIAAVDPWSQPAQLADGLPEGSYGMDLLRLREFPEGALNVPSLGWQLAAGCIRRGVPPALEALLSLPSAPTSAVLTSTPVDALNFKLHLKDSEQSPSAFHYDKSLDATLLGLVLDRQMCRYSPRDDAQSMKKTLGLLRVVLGAGVDLTQPVVRGEIHPLALAQTVEVFDALVEAGALTCGPAGRCDAIGAQVWAIPFLYQERWAALPPVLDRWKAIAAAQWASADNWMWAFVDSFATMPVSDVSHKSHPFAEILLPTVRVGRAGKSSPSELRQDHRSWVGGLVQGMTENFFPRSLNRSHAYLAEDLENAQLGQGWSPLPGEQAWACAALSLGLDKDALVLGNSRRRAFCGSSTLETEDLSQVLEALASKAPGALSAVIAWTRLSNGLAPSASLEALSRVFLAAVANSPSSVKTITYGTGNSLDSLKPQWNKTFGELCAEVAQHGLQTPSQAMVLLGLGVVLRKLRQIPTLGDLGEALPSADNWVELLAEADDSASERLSAWVRSQSLLNALPAPQPTRRGPRF